MSRWLARCAIVSIAWAAHGWACPVYDPSPEELADVTRLLATDVRGTPDLLSVCAKAWPPLSASGPPKRVAPYFWIRYTFAWDPHRRLEDVSFRWQQICSDSTHAGLGCHSPRLQASVLGGPWFPYRSDLREEDILTIFRFAGGLLEPGQAIVGIEPWPIRAGSTYRETARWRVRDHGYAVSIADGNSTCVTLVPVRFQCELPLSCRWIVDLGPGHGRRCE